MLKFNKQINNCSSRNINNKTIKIGFIKNRKADKNFISLLLSLNLNNK